MRPSLVRWLLDKLAPPKGAIVADPMAGIGTTLLLAGERDLAAIGAEIDRFFRGMAELAFGKMAAKFRPRILCPDATAFDGRWLGGVCHRTPDRIPAIALVLTSPPFPSAHSPGQSRLQDALAADKRHDAGGGHGIGKGPGQFGFPRSKRKWQAKLLAVIGPWVQATVGRVAVHIKNHVEGGKEIRADLWVAEVLHGLGLDVEGYHPAPLGYASGYREWQRYPRVPAKSWGLDSVGKVMVTGPCGHSKAYRRPVRVRPKSFVCVGCGVKPGHVEVLEERVVIASRGAK
jgi:hypothetical protein